MRVVAALGGHALLRRSEPLQPEVLRTRARVTAKALAPVARDHELVVTFGHGPLVALATAHAWTSQQPVDVLAAGVAGAAGYVLEQELANELGEGEAAFLLTRTRVDPDDPAFSQPTTPFGQNGTTRMLACPEPLGVGELRAMEALLGMHIAVVTAGCGGVPVSRDPDSSRLRGVDAIVDRDLVSALLARELAADVLVILANVKAFDLDWATWASRPLGRTTPGALRTILYELAQGTISPMVEAACRFVEQTGGRAAIGAIEEAAAVVAGRAGTQIVSDPSPARRVGS